MGEFFKTITNQIYGAPINVSCEVINTIFISRSNKEETCRKLLLVTLVMMTPMFSIKKCAKIDLKMTELEQQLDEIVHKFQELLENKHNKDNFDK